MSAATTGAAAGVDFAWINVAALAALPQREAPGLAA